MARSSLQQRTRKGASSKPNTTAPAPQNRGRNSLESCFSAGLDLAEFANSSSNTHGQGPVAASADLAQRKMKAAQRRHKEIEEEAALERRVADVVDSSKNTASSSSCSENLLGEVVPRATNPHNNSMHEAMGKERNDNFIQFQDNALGNNGFLSSLVSNHKSEGQQGSTSHRSRTLLKNNNQLKKQQQKRGMSTSRRQDKQYPKNAAGAGRKVAKKAKKSKY